MFATSILNNSSMIIIRFQIADYARLPRVFQ